MRSLQKSGSVVRKGISADSRRRLARAASVAAIALGTLSARAVYASSINYAGVTTVASTSTGAGSAGVIGTDGYEFLDVATTLGGTTGANMTSNPTYVTSITLANIVSPNTGSSYSQLAIGGITRQTGIWYWSGAVTGTPYTVATIDITTNTTVTIPSELQLGLLEDNGSTGNESDFTVSDTQSGGPATITDPRNSSGANDFYLVDISGATYGDVVTITGTRIPGTGSLALGGITFDTVPAPEPTMLSLLAVGALGLLARRRRTC